MKDRDSFGLVTIFLRAALAMVPVSQTPWKPPPSKSAAINRWTGKPHEHNRAKARRLNQVSA